MRTYHVATAFERRSAEEPIQAAEVQRATREARDQAATTAQVSALDDPDTEIFVFAKPANLHSLPERLRHNLRRPTDVAEFIGRRQIIKISLAGRDVIILESICIQ